MAFLRAQVIGAGMAGLAAAVKPPKVAAFLGGTLRLREEPGRTRAHRRGGALDAQVAVQVGRHDGAGRHAPEDLEQRLGALLPVHARCLGEQGPVGRSLVEPPQFGH